MAMAAQQEYAALAEEDAEELSLHHDIDDLQVHGIGVADLKKCKEHGICTVEAILHIPMRELSGIKGLSEEKLVKMRTAAAQILQTGFTSAMAHMVTRKELIRIRTGNAALDELLGGGVESGSITELYGEFRCGKTQLCHTLAITCQLPVSDGGGEGKALWIDTEGTFRPERLHQIGERFDMTGDDALENVAFARAHSTDEQFELLKSGAAMLCDSRFSLLIVDSATALFRTEFKGRGELSERQNLLGRFLRLLQRFADEFGVAVVITNQVVSDQSGGGFPGGGGNPIKAIGGNIMAHATTTRLKLSRSGARRKIKLESSPLMPEGDAEYQITENGFEGV